MAAVLDAMAPYVTELITGMVKEEVHMLLGVSDEITKLESNMQTLKAFVADAERRRITDLTAQRWVTKLKNAMYDASDILDLCQLEADERRESKGSNLREKMPGCFQPLLFCLRNPVHAHKIGSRIKELNERLDAIHKEANKLKINIGLGSNPEPRKPTDVEQSSIKATPHVNVSAIIGEKIERETKELVQVITNDDNHNINAISIVGMGGMGKTTLAQKIYNDTTTQEHFKIKIWLSITQNFDETQLLRTAIKYAGGHHGEEEDKGMLTQILIETLSKDRFLVVMDDVWSEKAWDNVLSVPIRAASDILSKKKIAVGDKQPGSRVLLTTRLENLAPRMRIFFQQHHASPMDNEDSWSLLKAQLPPNQVDGIDQLKDVGMKIAEKCGGLPLAVKVMGGLLSTRCPNQRDWEDVLSAPAWSVSGLPLELDNRIYMSYADLTPQLKQCFLYCSLFPKGTSIWNFRTIPMWISEGFIRPQVRNISHDDDRLEELATKCYQDLITRNLIEPTQSASRTGYECTMHDVIRSFAQFIARDELLVVQDDQVKDSGNDCFVRRLSVGSTGSVLEWAILQKHESLRTLVLNRRVDFKPHDSLSSFPSLRVLFIEDVDCDKLVESLSQLRHLRYLNLDGTNISKLPDNINRMRFLQHIVLANCYNLDKLPSSITELVHLRTLHMEDSNINVVPKGIGGLTNPRVLIGFPVHMGMDGEWCSLEVIAPLSQLRNLTVKGLENVSSSSFAEKAMISSKSHLSYLELNCSSSRSIGSEDEIEQKQQVIEEVYDKLCPPNCIENLGMEGYFGRRLPNWMSVPAIAAFSLRFLHFEELTSCIRLPDGLCRLPCLEAFTIIGAPAIKSVGPEFQAASSLAVGGGAAATSAAFPKLRSLQLEDLSEWEEWEWEERGEDAAADTIGMPALEKLYIKNCKLSRLPPGLANSRRHALRELNLYQITNLTSVENFPSVVDLDLFDCPELKRISGLSRLQKTRIVRCPNVEVLEGVPVLDSLELEDTTMETLPGYLEGVSPRYLKLTCGDNFYDSLFSGSSSELEKISHIRSRNIYCLEDSEEDSDEHDEDSDED
ncbi:hypothetical protein ACP70R_008805 [Stipagrostis hirtigluma subsp. patula]